MVVPEQKMKKNRRTVHFRETGERDIVHNYSVRAEHVSFDEDEPGPGEAEDGAGRQPIEKREKKNGDDSCGCKCVIS